MLPRDERLTSAEFARIWESGKPLRHALLTARALRRADEAPARCAFVVPRKSGKAAARNRLRRRVRECYRLGPAHQSGILRGHSVIFLINAARAEANATQWTQAFEELARRIVRENARRDSARSENAGCEQEKAVRQAPGGDVTDVDVSAEQPGPGN